MSFHVCARVVGMILIAAGGDDQVRVLRRAQKTEEQFKRHSADLRRSGEVGVAGHGVRLLGKSEQLVSRDVTVRARRQAGEVAA